MNKIKEKALDLLNNNKPFFIFISLRLAVSFLLFLSVFFTFFKVIQLFDINKIQPTEFPGSGIFILLMIVLPIASVFLLLLENTKFQKPINLSHAIISSIFLLWGLLLFFATKSEAATVASTEVKIAFGFFLQLLLICYLWIIIFGEKKLVELFEKYLGSSKEVTSSEPDIANE